MGEEQKAAKENGEEKVMEMEIDGLTEEEIREVQKIFKRFLKTYKANQGREIREWLSEQLQEELPDKEEKEIREMADEICESIEDYGKDLEDLDQSCKRGITKESWLAEKIQDSGKGMAVNQFGGYLHEIDRCMEQSNKQMERTILRGDGGVSQNMNLDGFIAEQYHVNHFNAKAALEQSPYRARVCVPENGGYGKNSVDVMIDNVKTGQKGVARYQMKFGKDVEATAKMLADGEYANQRLVVPKEQVEEIQRRFPGKSVTDCIGGTEQIPIQSKSITKEQVKELQRDAQDYEVLPKIDWNSYQAKELAVNIGKQAGQAGVHAALFGMGVNLVNKAVSGEPMDADEVVEAALVTGADTGIKAAAGGALKVASEKNMIVLLPPGTPGGTLAKIACVGVENVKILLKVATGEMTMSEAMEHMGRTSVSMYAGLSAAAVGSGIGAAALSGIPIVGPMVGGVIGGIVGYAAGSKVGEKIFDGAKKVVKTGIKLVKSAVESVKNVVGGILDSVLSILPF